MVFPSQSITRWTATGAPSRFRTHAPVHLPQARQTVAAMGRNFIRVRWASSTEPSRKSWRMPGRSTPAGQAWQHKGSPKRLPPSTEPVLQGCPMTWQTQPPSFIQGSSWPQLGQETPWRKRLSTVWPGDSSPIRQSCSRASAKALASWRSRGDSISWETETSPPSSIAPSRGVILFFLHILFTKRHQRNSPYGTG